MSVHLFQSTLPVWGGTFLFCQDSIPVAISIHPPRVGRDQQHPGQRRAESARFQSTLPVWGGTRACTSGRSRSLDFNPPSPCGEGRLRAIWKLKKWGFQSTLPVWGGTTAAVVIVDLFTKFQSTLPVWGGTRTFAVPTRLTSYFNPPSPCGEGPVYHMRSIRGRDFNPPSPCGEGRQRLRPSVAHF